MSLLKDFGLLGSVSVSQKRAMIVELRAEIASDKMMAKQVKIIERERKAEARAEKRANRIAALQAKIDALRNPVGAKAIKANRKPSKAIVTKLA